MKHHVKFNLINGLDREEVNQALITFMDYKIKWVALDNKVVIEDINDGGMESS